MGVLLAGQPHAKRAEWIESDLFARAMCVKSETCAVLILSCDVLMLTNRTVELAQGLISSRTGIDSQNVLIAATHTHSGPTTAPVLGVKEGDGYLDWLCDKVADVASCAWSGAQPARLFVAGSSVEGLAFCRRFLMRDGTVQTHPLKNDPGMLQAEGPVDSELGVIYALDDTGTFLGGIVNFACHATVLERYSTCISADYPGYTSRMLAEEMNPDSTVLFLNGPFGDVCQVDALNAGQVEIGSEYAQHMGRRLAEASAEAIRAGGQELTELRVAKDVLSLPTRRVPDDVLNQANQALRDGFSPDSGLILSDYGSETFGSLSAGKLSLEDLLATEWGVKFKASEAVSLAQEAARNPMTNIPTSVVTGGDFALVAIPCELFSEFGLEIKSRSPFKCTLVSGLTNGWVGYVPTEKAFSRVGGYETIYSTVSRLPENAGRLLTDRVLDLLQKQSDSGGANR